MISVMFPGPGGVVSGGGGATWTLVQSAHTFTTNVESVTVTTSPTTAGNLLIALNSYSTTDGSAPPTLTSMTGDSAWTRCPEGYAQNQFEATDYVATDCMYILNAAGGTTSFSNLWVNNASGGVENDLVILEYNISSGNAYYDTGGVLTPSSCNPNCSSPALTLNGTNDVILQWTADDNGATGPGAPYTSPNLRDTTIVGAAFAGALNQSSGAAITWTAAITTPIALAGVAFTTTAPTVSPISLVGAWQHAYTGVSITIPAGSPGDWIVFMVSGEGSPTGPAATGSVNGAYTLAATTSNEPNTTLLVYYFQNASASGETVTFTFSGMSDIGVSGGRFTGVSTTNSLRSASPTRYTGASSTTYSSAVPVSPNVGDLIIIAWANEASGTPGTITPASGYVVAQNDESHYDAQLYNLAATVGSQIPGFTAVNSTDNWAMIVLDVAAA